MVEIRKSRREESLQKKRREGLQSQQIPSSLHSTVIEKKVNSDHLSLTIFFHYLFILNIFSKFKLLYLKSSSHSTNLDN